MNDSPIFVTQPHLPPLEDLIPLLKKIWDNHTLTNNGPLHQQLEEELSEYLGVDNLVLFANGTLALVTALRALDIKGEVITTPYSFVATAHSLLWNNIKPVFVDIDPYTLNLDPSLIEASITKHTTAILPVHCYGVPCNVDKIEEIATKYGLKVIYDAAHAFGVNCHCGSILNHGHLSVLSFHATKIFNTFEGGAVVCPDKDTKAKLNQLKNFGFVSETDVVTVGINAKMNELQAAVGLLELQTVDDVISRRKAITLLYYQYIDGIDGLSYPLPSNALRPNYAYLPVLVHSNYPLTRDELYHKLIENNIFCRRYFYPLITEFTA